ncbi:MAG: 1,4-dihydroxy-2-naphthoate prenyltransferase [Pseudonocardiales bacterium]|nr:1,4-dihydroxy-2-naphthoate prenyltransferase [Pseudonocardiales bacterium]
MSPVATAAQWVEGARLRTLPAAIAPVIAGTGVAAYVDAVIWWRAALALVVGLAMQVGVNYANDYSDGIRGTDDVRVGPLRLVGSGVATPKSVKLAAFACFGIGAVAGLALAAVTTWWLLLVGVAAIAAAWTYTGGPSPYGYRALGDVSVFLFFGLVAVLGTVYVQTGGLGWAAWAAAIAIGALACAILMANNLRDIATDITSDKRTLAVLLGDARTRIAYVALIALPLALAIALAITETPWALLAAAGLALAIPALRAVLSGATGRALIVVLKTTGLAELAYAALLAVGLAIAAA